jgi:two-component system, response regulator
MKNLRHILIIEDNTDDQVLLLRQLKSVQVARPIKVIHDGGKALEYLMNERFKCEDLAAIFLDLNLPTIDGLRLLEAIRSESRFQKVPVIVMTSSNSPEDLEKCRRLGVSYYVSKPVTLAKFAQAFSDTFQDRRAPAKTSCLLRRQTSSLRLGGLR